MDFIPLIIWTPQQNQLMTKLFYENKNWDEITKSFPGRTVKECQAHGTYDLKLFKKRNWTLEQDQLMIDLFNKGKTWRQIAEAFSPLKNYTECYAHGYYDLKLTSFKRKRPVEEGVILGPNKKQKTVATQRELPAYYMQSYLQFQNSTISTLSQFKTLAQNEMLLLQNSSSENLESECEKRAVIYDTLYQHASLYQIDQASKSIYKKLEPNFINLYSQLISQKISLEEFGQGVITLECAYRYNKLKNEFAYEYKDLSRYFKDFSLQYQQLLKEIANIAVICLHFPKPKPGQHWNDAILSVRKSTMPLEGIIQRMREVANFLNDTECDNSIENIIMARLRNDSTSEAFIQATTEATLAKLRHAFLQKLGMDPTQKVTMAELDKLYKKSMLKLHPDKGGADEETVKSVNSLREAIKTKAGHVPQDTKF